MNYNKFNILEFNWSSLEKNPHISLFGGTIDEQSKFICKLVKNNSYNKSQITVCSRLIDMWPVLANKYCSDSDSSIMAISNLLERQMEKIPLSNTGDRELIIIDYTIFSDEIFRKSDKIMELLLNGRHHHIGYVLINYRSMAPEIRLNMDNVVLLPGISSTINIKKMWDNYFSMFQTLAAFEKVYKKCTEDNTMMILDNRKTSYDIMDMIFWSDVFDRENSGTDNNSEKESIEIADIKFNIDSFDWTTLPRNPHISLFGGTIEEQNQFINKLVKNNNYDKTRVTVFSRSEDLGTNISHQYYSNLEERVIKLLLMDQAREIERLKEKSDSDKFDIRHLAIINIMSLSSSTDLSLTELILNARHYQIGYVLINHPTICSDLMLNMDNIVLLPGLSRIQRHNHWNSYFSMFPTLFEFDTVYKHCSSNNNMMILNARRPSDNIREKIFWEKISDQTNLTEQKTDLEINSNTPNIQTSPNDTNIKCLELKCKIVSKEHRLAKLKYQNIDKEIELTNLLIKLEMLKK